MTTILASSSTAMVGFVSHAAAALAYCALILLLIVRWRIRGIGLAFLSCLILTMAWGAMAAIDYSGMAVDALDTLRLGGWLGFLALLLAASLSTRAQAALAAGLAALIAGNLASDVVRFGDGQVALTVRLALPVAGLILIENLVRNGSRNDLWAGKFLFVGLGVMWAYELFVDAQALLFRQLDPDLIAARGAIQTLIVPLLAVAAARNPSWSLEIGISRGAVFHTAALMASGLFLLLMACAGYYLRQFGGGWGPLLQVSFLTGAGIVLAVVVASGRARGQLRVFISKHFFAYKYDYRVEWHRFIDTLGGAGRGGALSERVIKAIADIMDSPGGAIWLHSAGASDFVQAAAWNFPSSSEVEAAEGEFARYLGTGERIVTLPGSTSEPQAEIAVPAWLAALDDAWLVVPLKHPDRLLGFLVLRKSRAPRSLNWEDWDLLRTVGRQAAGYLAEQAAIQSVADARQLEAFNRRFAFVVHDLKNLVSPLALLLGNAELHADNPAFQEDLIATVGESVARMKRMLNELGAAPRARRSTAAVPVATMLARIGQSHACSALRVEPADSALAVLADADLLAAALGHLVQNAIEAVRGTGRVALRAICTDERIAIEVEDDGPGMSPAFVRDELFRPLTTTKPTGYGIGAFQARELVREMGGRLDVQSVPGVGTTMRVSFPRHAEPARAEPTVDAVALMPIGAVQP
jgi:putative PEP-CTERM system histidine kinase